MKMKIKYSLGALEILLVILVDAISTESLHEVVNNGEFIQYMKQDMREVTQNLGKCLKIAET